MGIVMVEIDKSAFLRLGNDIACPGGEIRSDIFPNNIAVKIGLVIPPPANSNAIAR
jgi:hypothetical protein